MAITKKLKAEIRKVYDTYWRSYLTGDLKTFASCLDDSFWLLGTTPEEVFTSKAEVIRWYKKTRSQFLGKVDLRERNISMKMAGTGVVLHETCDLYGFTDGQWSYYAPLRITTILQKKNNRWKLVQQHGSLPDNKVGSGETIGLDKVKAENVALREAVRKRTVELETKNRELQIEAALERVRARAMAMHHSNELSVLVDALFKELTTLDFALTFCIINVINEADRTNTVWAANPETGKDPESYHMKFEDYKFHHAMWKAWKARKTRWVYTLEGREKKIYDEYLFKQTEFRRFPKKVQEANRALQRYVAGFTFCNFGGLQTVGEKPIAKAHLDILARFGKVFDLTYTRFLDLQKAEAQARESQIQLALERVRARTMAMHKSEELAETVHLLFQQFKELGENPDQATIGIINEKDWVIEYWVTMYGDQINKVFRFTINEPNVTQKIYKAWKEGKKSLVIDLSGKALSDFMKYRASMGGAGVKPEKKRIINVAFFSQGLLNVQSLESRSVESVLLLERFAKVFEQTYTRFLDLQKAEAQAREAQIQLALERVRARTMAMQKSEELPEAANLLFMQLQSLGMPAWSAGYCIWNENKSAVTLWMSSEGVLQPPFTAPTTEDELFIQMREGYEKGKNLHVVEMGGEKLVKHYSYMRKLPVVGEILDSIIVAGHPLPTFQIMHQAYFSKGFLLFITYESVPEAHDIFKRFAKVFEQTYTRFLDLQKAEAQAREAQIEAALEKVRSRSLAMHKSEELNEVVSVLFEKLKDLQIPFTAIGIGIYIEGSKDLDSYVCGENEVGLVITNYRLPYFDHKIAKDFNSAREQHLDFFVAHYSKEEKNSFYEYLFEHTAELKHLPDDIKRMIFESQTYTISMMPVKNAVFNVNNFEGKVLSEGEVDIIKRFARVFDQAYTRFLDLQKAETQAREAQIEAALERVRSKTMAMHNSQEVGESVATLFDELLGLGALGVHDRCGIGIMQPQEKVEAWTAAKTPDGKAELTIGHLNMKVHPLLQSAYQGWVDRMEINQYILEGEDKLKYYDAMRSQSDYKIKRDYYSEPMRIVHTDFYFNEGCLYVFSQNEFSADSNSVFNRFVSVFGQTYRRYLDLQKAEAQAREAQIEAALERVRSRTMAMHNSDELKEVIKLVYQQLIYLKINLDHAGFVVDYTPKGDWHFWIADEQDIPSKITHPYFESVWANQFNEANEKGADFFATNLTFEEKNKFYNKLLSYVPGLPEASKDFYLSYPGLAASTVLLDNVGLYIENFSGTPYTDEENATLMRFGKVFQQTYTRFLDLQKAEAQAKEAVKRSSLDRIRGEIASMRTTKDLDRITPLIWKELTTLNIPFIRCGVFIMDESLQQIHTFLSTPDGSAIAAFHLPYGAPGRISEILASWNNKQVYIEHWDETAFSELGDLLVEQGAVPSKDVYLKTIPKGGVHLHCLPFMQGMLYVGNTVKLKEDDIQLIQSVADAFATAYARYEDFNKLEAAKQQVDKTLVDLKQTQQQLIQSEKMASLGELTAGIAHEIQNPLNFVNNFSEVNKELLAEMEEAIKKGDFEEAIALSKDIIDNQEKINHHGKRAEGIVKGMLQHSRAGSGKKELTDINALCDEYLRLSYHGLRAKDKSFNAKFETHFDDSLPKIEVMTQDIGRVVLNLINNAFYVVNERFRVQRSTFQPLVIVHTKNMGGKIEISVSDNGNGIPDSIKEKIFQPFFTTKPTGQGTGLGLSLSYDIVKAHGGEISVESKEGKGTEFTIKIPVS